VDILKQKFHANSNKLGMERVQACTR